MSQTTFEVYILRHEILNSFMELIQNKHFSQEQIDQYKEEFESSKPFHHIILDDFLSTESAEKLHNFFPEDELFNKPKKDKHER